jgi:hypothetical protein
MPEMWQGNWLRNRVDEGFDGFAAACCGSEGCCYLHGVRAEEEIDSSAKA